LFGESGQQVQRRDFLLFGEGFGIDKPFETKQMQRIASYMRGPNGQPLLPSMLNFPLYGAINDAFARGHPTAELAYRISAGTKVYEHPHTMANFLDNHDVDRFLAGGSVAGLKQGLLLLMTLPGIPVIYAGTEQGFTERQPAMFKAGFHSGGLDHFDETAPLYRYLQRVIALRREHPLFSRGLPEILRDNSAGPGVLAYRTRHQEQAALVVFNTADTDVLLANLDTGLPAGTRLTAMAGIDMPPPDVVVGAQGRITLRLPPRCGWVWSLPALSPIANTHRADDIPGMLSLNAPHTSNVQGDFAVSGLAPPSSTFSLVVDADLSHARTVTANAAGQWHAFVDTSRMIAPKVAHSVVAWDEASGATSASRSFRVTRPWTLLANRPDPQGDDRGPAGRYEYPDDPGWRKHRQADIRQVRVYGSGGALRIELTMQDITSGWNTPNGFDHVAITAFLELPGRTDGSTVMPLQSGILPGAMRWHVRLRSHGWSNAVFSSAGASASNEGTPIAPAAEITVDPTRKTISFTLPAATLGDLKSLSGVRLYLNTWDYDDGYRPLHPQAGRTSFGGGEDAADPLVMDDIDVITLP
jgi:hypothetical protein